MATASPCSPMCVALFAFQPSYPVNRWPSPMLSANSMRRLPVLIVGPGFAFSPTPHRVAIGPQGGGRSPTRTGPDSFWNRLRRSGKLLGNS